MGDDQPLHAVAEGAIASPLGGELEPHGEDHAEETEDGDDGPDEGDGVAETEDPGVGVPTVYKWLYNLQGAQKSILSFKICQ